jgi:hypothetical protein
MLTRRSGRARRADARLAVAAGLFVAVAVAVVATTGEWRITLKSAPTPPLLRASRTLSAPLPPPPPPPPKKTTPPPQAAATAATAAQAATPEQHDQQRRALLGRDGGGGGGGGGGASSKSAPLPALPFLQLVGVTLTSFGSLCILSYVAWRAFEWYQRKAAGYVEMAQY